MMKNLSSIISQRLKNYVNHMANLHHGEPTGIFVKKLVSCIMICSNRMEPLLQLFKDTVDEIELSTLEKTHHLLLYTRQHDSSP